MKQVFQMKTILLSALLCAAGFGIKAQTVAAVNRMSCDAITRFSALDPVSCTIIATDPTTYTIPANTLPGAPIFITPNWTPGSPGVNYLILAEVADAACGFPGVVVGGRTCGYTPGELPLPNCPGCSPSKVAISGPVYGPGVGGTSALDIHP